MIDNNPDTESFFSHIHYMQSPSYADFMHKLGWTVETLAPDSLKPGSELYLYSKKLPLLGSLIKIPRSNITLPWEIIDRYARRTHAIFVKIEPLTELHQSAPSLLPAPYKPDAPILPTKTIVIDLSPAPEEIERNLKGDVRTSLRHAEKEKLVTVESDDIDLFYDLFTQTAKERGFYHPFAEQMKCLWHSFQPHAKIILTFEVTNDKQSLPLAGCFILKYDKVSYYKYAASTPLGRKKGAPYATLWKALNLAKKAGCRYFDLEGITDERYAETKKYAGFTHFKRSWGGEEFTYLGSFAKPYSLLFKLLSLIGPI